MKNLSPEMNAELRRAVKAFNRKIRRLEAKGVTASLLPEKASAKALKNAYKDSESLQARLDQMASFTSKGSTRKNRKGVVGTDSMFDYRKLENQNMIKYYKDQLASSYGQKTKYKSKIKSYRENLRAKIKYLSKSPENMDTRGLLQQSKNTLTPEQLYKKNLVYRENYYRKMEEYGAIGDVDPKKIRQLQKKLDEIPVEDFYRVIDTNPEFADIQDFMLDSPSYKGIKRARPRYEPEDVAMSFNDLINSADEIIANSL